jgi:hypothetical protein
MFFILVGNTNANGNPLSIFGNNYNNNNNISSILNNGVNRKFESSDSEDDEDGINPEEEIEIKGSENKDNNDNKPKINIEVNKKFLSLQIKELFVYDFAHKKYISKGSCKFSIEFDNCDEKNERPILVFRNSALQMVFQGIYNKELTNVENHIRENNKYFVIVQKVIFLNEDNEHKKIECKSLKLSLFNKEELDIISNKFLELKNSHIDLYNNFEGKKANDYNANVNANSNDRLNFINNNNSASVSKEKEYNNNSKFNKNDIGKEIYDKYKNKSKKKDEEIINKSEDYINNKYYNNHDSNNDNDVIIIDQKIEISAQDLKLGKKIQINLTIVPENLNKKK